MLGGGGVVITPWLASELMLQACESPYLAARSRLCAPLLLHRGRRGCSGRPISRRGFLSAAPLQRGGQKKGRGREEGGTWALQGNAKTRAGTVVQPLLPAGMAGALVGWGAGTLPRDRAGVGSKVARGDEGTSY